MRGLTTSQKIGLARWLLRLVRVTRLLTGQRGTEVVCRRRGVRWSLDIREGVQLALYLGVYERMTGRRLEEIVRPGAVVVDVGANVGAHALPLARMVGPSGRVVAIEPTAAAFRRLNVNADLNPELRPRITAVQAAVGAPGGALHEAYYSAWPLEPGDARHPVHLGERHSTSSASFSTLDALVVTLAVPRVDVIKIDVDGSELDVLRGASELIRRDQPDVVFEVCPYLLDRPGNRASDLFSFFTGHGYALLDERTMQPVGTDPEPILAAIPERGGRNLIARGVR